MTVSKNLCGCVWGEKQDCSSFLQYLVARARHSTFIDIFTHEVRSKKRAWKGKQSDALIFLITHMESWRHYTDALFAQESEIMEG